MHVHLHGRVNDVKRGDHHDPDGVSRDPNISTAPEPVAGSSTFSSGGTIVPRSPFTGSYTLNTDCTGTLTIGTSLHFDLYVAPSGDRFTYVQTDPGLVSVATETRVARP